MQNIAKGRKQQYNPMNKFLGEGKMILEPTFHLVCFLSIP